MPAPSPVYIADRTYLKLVHRLYGCGRDLNEIKTVLGDVGGIWPALVKRDLARADKLASVSKKRSATDSR
jgi:hypothetical protein